MKTTKQKFYRVIAVYLLLNLGAELFAPVAAYALTNGPGQPEFQSFEPASSTEMVNLFTGDFSYNIPLMTVPGPNGGYPINLAYQAGIGMEQEASWVGLGWNINAGAINRSMRGLPDDFKGDEVIKKLHFKPSNSLVLNFGQMPTSPTIKNEKFGFNAYIGTGVQVYYNNYRGIGFQFAANFALSSAKQNSSDKAPPLNINPTSSSDGIGVNLNYSAFKKVDDVRYNIERGIGASMSLGSREGINAMQLSFEERFQGDVIERKGAGVSFVSSGFIPQSSPELEGFIADMGLEIGTDNNGDFKADKATSILASYSRSWIKYPTQNYSSYGYIYNESSNGCYGISDNHILQDINREKNNPATRQSKTLGVPIATYDSYNISGQGMGGGFRPYRSDVGIYTESNVTSKIYGGTANVEYGAPVIGTTWANWGVDASFKCSQSSSGMWRDAFGAGIGNGWGPIDDYVFQGTNAAGNYSGDHLYEPFYFKMAGELTSSPENQLDFIGGNSPVRLKLEEPFETGNEISPRPEIFSDDLHFISGSINLDNNKNHRSSREKTVSRNIPRTHGVAEKFTSTVPANIYSTRNSFPALGGSAIAYAYDYSAKSDHLLGEFTETGADGSRYVYGLPVFAYGTKEVMFSKNGFTANPTQYAFNYTSTEGSLSNDESGTDELYASTEVPGYAESFLLTGVYSPDYVDVTGNGPSEDDLGYYTKFNYVLADASYKWRAPYWGAIVNTGFLSNTYDDKLSYMFGTKEIYYLHSIETKTHVACFFLQDGARKDGHGAIAEFVQDSSVYQSQVATTDPLWALDHISLYSKADPNYGTSNATPIKSAYFTYTSTDGYRLCPGVSNNENTSSNTGKLTLNEIYFTYRNNNKGKLSPYKFEYIDASYDADLQNPSYNPKENDRWGTYKKQSGSIYLNHENSYTDQLIANRSRADQSAAVWSLKRITMPSGSVVDIKYEADDYAYVQNKTALQMCRVVGLGDAGVTDPALATDVKQKFSKKNRKIYFELNEPADDNLSAAQEDAIIQKYINGVDEMYFKMFMSLKKPYGNPTGSPLYDYVDGFCKISKNTSDYGIVDEGASTTNRFGYITVDLVDRDDYPAVPGGDVHPIEKAAWQHIYLDRPDLFANPDIDNGAIANLITATTNIITEIPRVVAPYITANARGWGNTLDINTSTQQCSTRPSYIRLNTPDGKKVGGGHRVKEIKISDKWNAISGSVGAEGIYGQSYTYKLTDGRSSGVASYEPLVGGEENAMCLPIRYNSDHLVKKDNAFYVMAPIGESYYPAPVVGYSRVIVTSLIAAPESGQTVNTSRTGKTEYEFYTAKDYPVFTDRTDLQKTWFPIPVVIPFVGSISYNMRGFSQGYSIELNDMHGKLKAVSTYPSYADLLNLSPMPTRRVFYKYNGGYDANQANRLSSTVDVLTSDGVYSSANLGETYDFFFDMNQHANETQEIGLQLNAAFSLTPYGFVPTAMATINLSKSLCRSVVAMKVIYRTGILTEVETMDDGAKSTARNLMFDAETGAPLLTEVQNEFERPVYTYNFAGHWAYDGMQGAYKNQGVRFNGFTTSGGNLTVTNANQYFSLGDEVMFIPASGQGTMYWVDAVTSTTAHLIDANGAAIGNVTGDFIIHRSGKRNLQSVSDGVIVSLSNPVTARQFPLFTAFNSYAGSITTNPQTINNFFTDCATGQLRDVAFSWNGANSTLTFSIPGGGCEATLTFPAGHGIDDLAEAFTWDLFYAGGTVTAIKGATTLNCSWTDNSCFKACLDDVLHASAVRFSENWSADVGGHEQKINFADAGLTVTSTNDYKFGLRGVWRTHSNYLYQIDRKQATASTSGTDIGKDGTYNNFVLYNWKATPQNNTNWSFVSSVTRYSPYGYALETRDALGIYSSTMYGYNNTKQVSSAANCKYFEMAFDGFEEYASQYTGRGHLLFNSVNQGLPIGLTSTYAHSGTKSLAVEASGDGEYSVSCDGAYTSTQQYFEAIPGQEYSLSVWVRAIGGGTPAVVINTGSGDVVYTPDMSKSPIEGWRKIDLSFIAPTGTLSIKLRCQTSGTAFFDDLRIQPFKSAMVSYVYDPQTHWLLAELDNRNFATFYNYDEEGALTQVKQETEKGIFTVQTSRGNIKRQ